MGHKHDRNRPVNAVPFNGGIPGSVPILGQSEWVPIAHAELAMNTRMPGQFGLQVQGPNGPNDVGVMQLFVDLMIQNMQQWLGTRKKEAAEIQRATMTAANAGPAVADVPAGPISVPDLDTAPFHQSI